MIHLVLADPFTMMAIGMGATLVGGGVKTVADWQAGKAASAADIAGAGAAEAEAAQLKQAAEVTRYAAGRAAQDVGLRGRAQLARAGGVDPAAGNIAGRSVTDVRSSIIALSQQRERETYAKGLDVAQQEDIRAAQERFRGGELRTAADQARTASMFAMAGDVTSAVGSSFGVASKWYQTGGTPGGDMGGGPTPDYALQGPATPQFLEEG